MRIVCIHPPGDPVACGEGPVRIGSDPDDTVHVQGAGVSAHHLNLVADRRGVVLKVAPGCQRVYVNARVVRECALLHYGDTLTLGTNKLLVASDQPPAAPVEAAVPVQDTKRRAALRIASGTASGQALRVAPKLLLGSDSVWFGELRFSSRVMLDEEGAVLISTSDQARVNGWPCERARLVSGDQLVLGEHHLVLEAVDAEQVVPEVVRLPEPRVAAAAESDDSPQTEIWWLIGAAAILAAIIALLLYFRW